MATPDGKPVAMAHSNNGSSDLDAWMALFGQAAQSVGRRRGKPRAARHAACPLAAADEIPTQRGLLSINYVSGERHRLRRRAALFVRNQAGKFCLEISSAPSTTRRSARCGRGWTSSPRRREWSSRRSAVTAASSKAVTPVSAVVGRGARVFPSASSTAGEGGAWGMAVLAAYLLRDDETQALPDYLDEKIAGTLGEPVQPDARDVEGFSEFFARHKKGSPSSALRFKPSSSSVTYRELKLVLVLFGGFAISSRAFAQASPVVISVDATSGGAPLEPGVGVLRLRRSELHHHARRHGALAHARRGALGPGASARTFSSTRVTERQRSSGARRTSTPEDSQESPSSILRSSTRSWTRRSGRGVPAVRARVHASTLSTRPDPYENSGTYTLDSGAFYPPRDYEKMGGACGRWAEHARDRYSGGQTNWIWELWNEPDIGYWQGTPEEYARLYDYTEAALHAVLPDARLGGPAVARPDGSFLKGVLGTLLDGDQRRHGTDGDASRAR